MRTVNTHPAAIAPAAVWTSLLMALLAPCVAAAEPAVDTRITVGPHTILSHPTKSPVDAHGIRGAIRRGKPIPSGYRIVGRAVSITLGAEDASTIIDLTCPRGTTHRGVETEPLTQINYTVVGNTYRDSDRRRVTVIVRSLRGRDRTASGTVYLVCRR